MSFLRPFSLPLILPLVAVQWLGQAPAQAAEAVLGRPRFDPTDRQLILPFTGEAPAFVRGALEGPPRIFLDFEASTRIGGGGEELPGHPLFLRWAMAPRGPERTRLVLHLRAPVALTVAIDPRRKALVLLGEPGAARPTPAPTPSARPSAVPSARASARPSARPSLAPTPRPSLAPTPRPSLAPSAWPSVPPSPRPTPVPSLAPSAWPSPEAVQVDPTPSPEPSPIPLPSPSPSPTPAPSLRPVQAPQMRLGLQVPVLAHEEQGAGIAYTGGLVRAVGGAWLLDGVPGPGWGARAEGLAIGSTGYEGGVLQARQDLRGAFDLLRAESLGPLTFQVGVGAMGRYEVAAQASPNPLSASFAPWRAFFGPELLLGLQLAHPALPGWSVRMVGAGSPYVVALLPQGALPSGLWSHRVDAAVVAPVGPLSLSLGLRRWGMNATGYQELAQGPFVALSAPWGATAP